MLDPPSQPWVTSVGGTSLETYNPGANPHPAYPKGVETVWNTDNLCSNAAPSAGRPGRLLLVRRDRRRRRRVQSEWWGRPVYQFGQGVNNKFTTTR